MKEFGPHIDFESLAAKYLSGSATPQEVELLESWVKNDIEKRKEFAEIRKNWRMLSARGRYYNKKEAWGKIAAQIKETKNEPASIPMYPKRSFARVWQMAAAVLLLIAGIYWVYHFTQFRERTLVADHQTLEQILADGTMVTLKKGASITFPGRLRGDERRVSLSGEAFFEVAHVDKSTFIIDAQGVQIKVLGTSFSVDAPDDQSTIRVYVATGKVAMITPDKQTIQVNKGEKAEYFRKEETIRVTSHDDPNILSWKTQLMVFENTTLDEVFAVVGNTYGLFFEISTPGLENCRLTATFQQAPLEDVLTIISETFEITYARRDGKIMVSGEGCDYPSDPL